MSNQIVQLTDKDNNNIFPVAGSMAGNSIETGMIKDEAVTSSKIDLTTLLPRLIQSNEKDFLTAASDTAIYGDNITITESGRYFAYCSVKTHASGTSGVLFVYININDSATNLVNTQFTTRNSAWASGDVARLIQLNAGDKIKGGFYGTSALGSLDGTVLTVFMIRIS